MPAAQYNDEIGIALLTLDGDVSDIRDLAMAAAYLDRAGKYCLANDVREQSHSKRKLANQQRMRIVSAIIKTADHPNEINPALIVDTLQASPKKLFTSLAIAGYVPPPQPAE